MYWRFYESGKSSFSAIVEHFLSKPEQLPEGVSLTLLKECLMNLRQLETFLSVILVGFKQWSKLFTESNKFQERIIVYV